MQDPRIKSRLKVDRKKKGVWIGRIGGFLVAELENSSGKLVAIGMGWIDGSGAEGCHERLGRKGREGRPKIPVGELLVKTLNSDSPTVGSFRTSSQSCPGPLYGWWDRPSR